MSSKAALNILIVIGVLVTLSLCASACRAGSNESEEHAPTARSAHGMCKAFVERDLIAPSTASFSPFSPLDVSASGDRYTIENAYVDAENRYGAMIRYDYRCSLDYIGDKKWELVALTFQ